MIVITRLRDLGKDIRGNDRPPGERFVFDYGEDQEDADRAAVFMWGKDFEYYVIEKNGKIFIPSTYEIGEVAKELAKFN